MRVAAVAAAAAAVLATATPAATGASYDGAPERGTPGRELRWGTPQQAGLVPGPVRALAGDVESFLAPQANGHPMYAGAVVLAAHDGVVVAHEAVGHALRYADGEGLELPAGQQVAMRRDSIFDLASVSKLFTSIAVLQQVERGRLDLDASVASYIPAFAAHGKGDVTVRALLTHTSGLPAWLPLYSRWSTPEERIAAVYDVAPLAPPGARYVYSDLNMITLGKLVELASGRPLDVVVREGITDPLGMVDTGYNPPADRIDRIVATEDQPWTGRGVIRGSVHDENAWSLGGVAGHAGVFSTARDLAVLAQTILNRGSYDGRRILSRSSVGALLTDENSAFPGHAHGLGFEIDQRWYMDALSGPGTVGHTGYTGTSLVIDTRSRSFVVLLTNRVHPSRDWGSNNVARRAVARDLALALPVRPRHGRDAWFSGVGDSRTATLTVPVSATAEDGPIRLQSDLWFDTEPVADTVTLEVSRDAGQSWATLRTWSGNGDRRWHDVTVSLGRPASTAATSGGEDMLVRWRYTSDALYQGRGVYVDGVRVEGDRGPLFDDDRARDADRVRADGWVRSRT
jgi:CubicO group peptidase (beta-lactamase class C family)